MSTSQEDGGACAVGGEARFGWDGGGAIRLPLELCDKG